MSLAWFRQVAAITSVSLRELPTRWVSSAVAVFGIAGVVMVMVGILSMAAGFQATLTQTSDPRVAMVLRAAATSELDSGFSREDALVIAESELIERGADGPLVSSELYVVVDVPRRSTGTSSNVPLRGVEPRAMAVRGSVQITEGRMFSPGLNEIIVGRGARDLFVGLELGSSVTWGTNTWTVVGIMEAGGGVPESEIWADLRSLQSAYRRGSSVQTLRARLADEDAFQEFKDGLTEDPRVNARVVRERDFYADQSRLISGLITGVGYFVAALMGLGAVFGAVNTMYTAVSSRMREIATWRALGFNGSAVFFSVLTEALALGLVGGLIGALIAYVTFNGFQVATMNWTSFSQLTFAFAVTPELIRSGVVYALTMGLLGGLLPAVRAGRVPITVALRDARGVAARPSLALGTGVASLHRPALAHGSLVFAAGAAHPSLWSGPASLRSTVLRSPKARWCSPLARLIPPFGREEGRRKGAPSMYGGGGGNARGVAARPSLALGIAVANATTPCAADQSPRLVEPAARGQFPRPPRQRKRAPQGCPFPSIGGGGGNRTRVRLPSARRSTCLSGQLF